jgi:hypothetical protein
VRAPDSTVGDHYQRSGFSYDEVFLLGRTPDSRSIVAHEIGHAIMDDIYEDAYPATPNCSRHKVDTASSAGCAWTEGFADWLPLAVYGTSVFKWQANSTYDLEPPTWDNAGFQDGDTVVGRVAGALLDLHDRRAESWDACAENRASVSGM